MKKSILYQWSYQIFAILIPIVTMPYISRILGAEGIGKYSYNYSIVNYFMLFAMLGVNTYGSRSIAQVRDNRQQLNETFSEIFFLQMVFSLIMTLFYIVYIIFFSRIKIISAIQVIYVLGCAFDINWFYCGIEAFKVIVIRNIVVKLLTIFLIFAVVKSSSDLNIYVLIMATGTVLSQSIMWMQCRNYVEPGKVNIIMALKKHFRGLGILFIPAIATSIYNLKSRRNYTQVME